MPLADPSPRVSAASSPKPPARSWLHRTGYRVRNVVWLLARPVRRARRERVLVIQPYRGFGSSTRLFLMGRVLRQPGTVVVRDRFARDLLDVGRRLFRRGVPGMIVDARLGDAGAEGVTDRDGYFCIDLASTCSEPAGQPGWQSVQLSLRAEASTRAVARVYVHAPSCRCLVISDIDDTVVETGVANRLVMLWRLFFTGPASRLPVPGLAALLRGLHRGPEGTDRNPLVFVSRAPWTIYETLDAFFRLQRLPRDAILFLREWGVRWYHPFARHDPEHKTELIRQLLRVATDPPVVLIGDSGQRDAEIYAGIVAEFPGRVAAVLIRDLARSSDRQRAIRSLDDQLALAGTKLVLTSSSTAMADAAFELGLVPAATVEQVRASLA
ncbi:MAG: phosphatase domain-containing protein [Pseudomonadota bacterium]